MKVRKASHRRKTRETDIAIDLTLEGSGHGDIKTPIPFFSHLLDNFTRHGGFDLRLRVKGDIEVDQHHTVEDTGIALGEAFEKALGDKKGINRAGYFVFPMDECLSVVAVDISGRQFVNFDVEFKKERIGDLESDLVKHFFEGFSRSLKATLHVRALYPGNEHHKTESLFKAFGKAMKMACSQDKRLLKELPSTKGKL
ncbi:MAG: imidazoleglycerol-phosphate dehydratase [Parcubacteria group bacterium Greene0714_21]|nr:MAG: imidazoleglycerol-phosphate dehydratase [Parcubacteria group bacterium Greene0416_39]TSD03947.1 MAG: imidazoleglycerol-phosphate dehydratase [Parcubacteria group bacterium Greene0714_21]